MSSPQIPQVPQLHEAFRFRPWPIGDPVPFWLWSQLSKEVIVELAKVQLEYEKAANAAFGNYISGVQNVLQKMGNR